jgi:hypothetical protein
VMFVVTEARSVRTNDTGSDTLYTHFSLHFPIQPHFSTGPA